jgi:hypothetical protein
MLAGGLADAVEAHLSLVAPIGFGDDQDRISIPGNPKPRGSAALDIMVNYDYSGP